MGLNIFLCCVWIRDWRQQPLFWRQDMQSGREPLVELLAGVGSALGGNCAYDRAIYADGLYNRD